MQKPSNYDAIQANPDGFTPLPAGGYVCKLMEVLETTSSSGRPMLKISLDIAEGEHTGYYANQYKTNSNKDKKWGAVMYMVTDGEYGPANLKRFLTAVEKSNKTVKVSWDDKFGESLKNKLVGVLFRREEYVNASNEAKWITKPFQFRSADVIRQGVEAPEDKPLAERPATNNLPNPTTDPDGFMNIPDGIAEELPF